MRRSVSSGMAIDPGPQGVGGRGESQTAPKDFVGPKPAGLEGFPIGPQGSFYNFDVVDGHDDGVAGVRIEAEKGARPDLETGLFLDFPGRGLFEGLAPVHKAARQAPSALGRRPGPPEHQHPAILNDQPAGGHFGVRMDGQAAGRADRTVASVRLDFSGFEPGGALRTITEIDFSGQRRPKQEAKHCNQADLKRPEYAPAFFGRIDG